MIKNKEEALELCKKYDIKLSDHKSVIVTGNNSIYVDTDNVDPADTSEKFYLKGKTISIEPEKEIEIKDLSDFEAEESEVKEKGKKAKK